MPAEPGGIRRWAILAVAWAAFLIAVADRLAWSNAAPSVAGALGLPVVTLGLVVTTFYAGYVVSNVLSGLAGDWFGPRWVLAGSLLGLAAATAWFGMIESVGTGLLAQAAMGLMAGADYAAGVKLISAWFGRLQRGRAMGLFMTATSLSVLLTNLVVPVLLDVVGWRVTYWVLGLVTALIGVAVIAVVRDAPAGSPLPVRLDVLRLLRNRQVQWLGLAGFGALWGTWGFTFWATTLMVRGHNLSVQQAGFVLALFGAGAIVSKPAMGLLSDLIGGRRRILVIVCLVLFTATLAVFSQLDEFAAFAAVGPLLGVSAFGYSPLMNTMVAEASGRAQAASGAGMTNAFWGLGNVIVPTLVGYSFALNGSFSIAFLLLAAGPLFGAACMLFTRDLAAESEPDLAEVFR